MFIGGGRWGDAEHLERSIFDRFRRQLRAIVVRLMRPSSDARQTTYASYIESVREEQVAFALAPITSR